MDTVSLSLTTCPRLVPRLKKEETYNFTPPLGFMAYCRVNFAFTLYVKIMHYQL